MSEFKYACPVCGQHMMCDSSQSGSVMECPTCFQKVVAPRAPASADSKLILSGQKYVEKKPAPVVTNGGTLPGGAAQKNFPLVIIIVLAVVLGAGAAVFVVQQKAQRAAQSETAPLPPKSSGNNKPKPKPPEPPKPVAPPANDALWLLNLDTATIPEGPVAGRIHGQNFIVERATFQNGTLTLRAGTHGSMEFGVYINFSGAQPEVLSGQTINVSTNADKAARITLRWKDTNNVVQKDGFDSAYALRLEFGPLAKDRLPGKIYLCTPDDEKSYLLGTFNADARKPKPKPPKN